MLQINYLKRILFYSFLLCFILSCKKEPSHSYTQNKHNENIISKDSDIIDSTSIITKKNNKIDSSDFTLEQDTIVEEVVSNPIDSTKKYIYLTFDDGPYKGSKNINKIIQEENIKATVFIVGLNAYTNDLKQFITDYQNNNLLEISNHTYTHANRNKFKQFYSNPNNLLDDVKKNEEFFGLTSKIVRLPGRNTWRMGKNVKNDHDNGSKEASNLLASNKYGILGWDHEWNRAGKNLPLDSPENIYHGIKYRLAKNLTISKNHLVLLMHDDMFNSDADAEKLRTLIKLLKTNPDIVFEVASNYPTEKIK